MENDATIQTFGGGGGQWCSSLVLPDGARLGGTSQDLAKQAESAIHPCADGRRDHILLFLQPKEGGGDTQAAKEAAAASSKAEARAKQQKRSAGTESEDDDDEEEEEDEEDGERGEDDNSPINYNEGKLGGQRLRRSSP